MTNESREKLKAGKRKHYLKYRDKYIMQSRIRRYTPGYSEYEKSFKRRSMLKQRYGMTDADYAAILLRQGGGCAVCHTNIPGNGKSEWFDVDHDHITGKVRGLLCRKCNVTLGVIERNRERIEKLEKYLLLCNDLVPSKSTEI